MDPDRVQDPLAFGIYFFAFRGIQVNRIPLPMNSLISLIGEEKTNFFSCIYGPHTIYHQIWNSLLKWKSFSLSLLNSPMVKQWVMGFV